MKIGRFHPPLQLIPGVLLLLASGSAATMARAQTNPPPAWGYDQSPINIDSRVPLIPGAPVFTDTAQLATPRAFNLKNTTGSHWCKDDKDCKGIVDQRWGALKAYPVEDPINPPPPVIEFGGAQYTLKEFHFHTPAEHLVDHLLVAMEMHLVFSKDGAASCSAGSLLVIGQRFRIGAANAELNKIFGPGVNLPPNYAAGPTEVKDISISRILLGFPATISFRYPGSLTAPAEIKTGCEDDQGNPDEQLRSGILPEVVSWFLLTDIGTVSEDQIARLRSLFPNGDARAPQPPNNANKAIRGADSRKPN
jgi:carbonic anhydrase